MKRVSGLTTCVLLLANVANVNALELETTTQQYSYAVGTRMGANMLQQIKDVDPEAFAAGIGDAMKGKGLQLTSEQMSDAMKQHQQAAKEKQELLAATNLKNGQDFLASNKSKEGVVALPSGLQYQVLTEGDGETPSADAKVTVHYRGTLIDGTEFDSSYKRGEPTSFSLNGVIKGFSEALSLMKTGAKWKVFIPHDLAYGSRGPGSIGPNQTLIFEMELISFEKAAEVK